jgi:hypothetical protein
LKTAKTLERYRKAVIRYGIATETGKPKMANKAFDEMVRLSHQFRRGGPEMQQAFLTLLKDENVWVRCDVATCALEFAPEEAVPVLRQIAAGPRGPVRLDAEIILEQWETGTLRLP